MYVRVKVFIDHDELAAQNSLHFYKIHSPRADGKNLADEDVTPHRP